MTTKPFAELKDQFTRAAEKSSADIDFCFEVLIKHRLTSQAEREEMTALYIDKKIKSLPSRSDIVHSIGDVYTQLHSGFASSCIPGNCDAVFKNAFHEAINHLFSYILEPKCKSSWVDSHLDAFLKTLVSPRPGTEHLLPADLKGMLAEFSLGFIDKLALNNFDNYDAAEAFRLAAKKIAAAAEKIKPPQTHVDVTAGSDMAQPEVTINAKKPIHFKIVQDSPTG